MKPKKMKLNIHRMRAWQMDDCLTVAALTDRDAMRWYRKHIGEGDCQYERIYEVSLDQALAVSEGSKVMTTLRAAIKRRRSFPCIIMETP